MLDRHDEIKALAHRVAQARDVLYLGRGNCFPIALEGALKLKEISYIHAEGYAAGEMKHGPIALIDKDVPVIAIVPSGPLFEKTASNLQEAAARGGQVIVFSDAAGAAKLRGIATRDDRAAGGGSIRGADPVCDPGAVAGLSRGGAEGHRRGSAAQSGEVGDGGVGPCLHHMTRMAKTVTLRDANQQFARCIREVEAGEELVITRNGTPVARLSPIAGRRVLSERQLAALERIREAMREGLPIGAGKLDRDALHER